MATYNFPDIQVHSKDDGLHVPLMDQKTRKKVSEALDEGSLPITFGQGKNRCTIEVAGNWNQTTESR